MKLNKIKRYSLFTVGLLLAGSVTFSCNNNKHNSITSDAIVTSTNSNYTKNVIDGNLSTSWEQEGVPAIIELDLGAVYQITNMKVYGYDDGVNYQKYKILYSTNNVNYDLYDTKETEVDSADGETFDKSFTARYIRLDIFDASIPTKKRMGIAHIREIKLDGKKGGKVEQVPTTDPNDPDNLAYLKKVSTNMPFMNANGVTAGDKYNYFRAKYCPMYADIDLGEDVIVDEIIVRFPEVSNYYYYTVYGSNNGDAFQTIHVKKDSTLTPATGDVIKLQEGNNRYRYLRFYLQYQDHNNTIGLGNITVHGSKTGENNKALRDGNIEDIIDVKPYDETGYAQDPSKDEIINNVIGIIDRIGGEDNPTNEWLSFELDPNFVADGGLDKFEISNASGKVLIKGNNGLMLASGVKYFWEKYCSGCVTEQTASFKFPDSCPTVTSETRINYAKNRYAFNYCTLDYSFAFFSDDEWQRELDYLALNGVNIVLDLAGQEAVWIKFLQNFGYNYDAAKAWLCGPSYYAWQFMQNMDVFGGCVTDGWVKDRLEYARKSQRWRNSLGMETCLQGFAGMVPNDFNYYQPDVSVIEQGGWNGFDRPDMLRTDSPKYAEYAKMFYDAQKWAFGTRNHHYAVDPFHEGGIRPDDLSDDKISSSIIQSLYASDEKAVWVIQAWHANPTCGLLDGIKNYFDSIGKNYQDHALILDLATVSAADLKFSTEQCSKKWDLKDYFHQDDHGRQETHLHDYEFNQTPWCLCMLENFGGNPSMDGHLRLMVERFAEVAQKPLDSSGRKAKCYAGIGLLNEATLDNPIIYNFLFDLAWVAPEGLPKFNKGEDSQDPSEWDQDAATAELYFADTYVSDYVTRRYGLENNETGNKIVDAWKDLVDKSIYSDITKRTAPFVMTMTPDLIPGKKVFEDAEELKGSNKTLEQSLKTLLCVNESGSINETQFKALAEMPGYRYDIVEIMRQVVSNTAVYRYKEIYDAVEQPGQMEKQARLDIIKNMWDEEEKSNNTYKPLFKLMDDVLSLNETWLASKWIGRAEKWGQRISDEGEQHQLRKNDFAIDSLMDSAKMLIVGWGHFGAAIHLNDYGERTYQGMLSDLYVNRWQNYIDQCIEYVDKGTPIKKEGKGGDYWYCREWMLNLDIHDSSKYVQSANDDPDSILEVANEVLKKGLNFNATSNK